nr:acetylcholinesterase 7 [Pardosa pseudoannulata]
MFYIYMGTYLQKIFLQYLGWQENHNSLSRSSFKSYHICRETTYKMIFKIYSVDIFKMNWIFLISSFVFNIASSETVIETSTGPIRSTTTLSGDVEAFLGIPYAEPPLGERRFARPVPKNPWEKVFDAFSLPPPCTQIPYGDHYYLPNITNMSEDCLYLNIWKPKGESSRGLRSVLVFIHPGAFITGATNMKMFDGSRFAEFGDVIIVTINYRLGSFGYFLAYTEEADGNMGMYDQVLALKWVKKNAKNFGGDPENIVLWGVSAGAYSVAAHILSPMSKELFKNAIIESGSIVHPYFLDNNNRLFHNSESLAHIVGCTNETHTLKSDPNSVVKCLKTKPKGDVLEAELRILKSRPFTFFPRVNDEFLPKDTVALLREGKFKSDVKVLIGVEKDEGGLFLSTGMPEYFGSYGKDSVDNFSKRRAVTIVQSFSMLAGESGVSDVIDFYAKNVKNRTSVGYLKMVAEYVGDYIITCNTVFFADFLSLKGNTVYFYKFGFRSPSTPVAEWMGTTHLDEMQYIFGNPVFANFTAAEEELNHRLMRRWSTFANTGNPNIPGHVPWLRYSFHNPLYLAFGQEEESIRLKPINRCEAWRKNFNAVIDTDLIRFLRNSATTKIDEIKS